MNINDLYAIYSEIDGIDDELLDILLKRLELTKKSAYVRRKLGLLIKDDTRDGEQMKKALDGLGYHERKYIKNIWSALLSSSLTVQEEIFGRYGIVGYKNDSDIYSSIHNHLGEYSYTRYNVRKENFVKFITKNNLNGFNVEQPYKKIIMPFCAFLSEGAKKLQSVDTVIKRQSGNKDELFGYNFDYAAMLLLIEHSKMNFSNKSVLIFGDGAEADCAEAIVKEKGASSVFKMCKSGQIHFGRLESFLGVDAIINTSNIGAAPFHWKSITSIAGFDNLECVIDTVCHPIRSRLIVEARMACLKFSDGLFFAVAKSKFSKDLFLNETSTTDEIFDAYRKIRSARENIVLIGLSGIGIREVGKYISEILQKPLYCVGKSLGIDEDVGKIFETLSLLEELSNLAGAVICIEQSEISASEIYLLMAAGGRIYHLRRGFPFLYNDEHFEFRKAKLIKRMEEYKENSDIEICLGDSAEESSRAVISEFVLYDCY